jgi:L-asparaginase/Glu-tRNA(Gln) amidotransferase subunit D
MADVTLLELRNEDSPNNGPSSWRQLGETILSASQNHDGIVAIVGSDTAANLGCATAFSFKGSGLPITFVGSWKPVVDPRSDFPDNLVGAFQAELTAIDRGIDETMLVFGGRSVLRAVRAMKVGNTRFASPAFPPVAHFTRDGRVQFSKAANQKADNGSKPFRYTPGFNAGVITIDASPDLDPDIVRAIVNSKSCAGLVIRALGDGNVPTKEEHDLTPVIGEATEQGKPVILTSSFPGGIVRPGMYETSRQAFDAGAGYSGDMTPVATGVKLGRFLWSGAAPWEINELMLEPDVGEISAGFHMPITRRGI